MQVFLGASIKATGLTGHLASTAVLKGVLKSSTHLSGTISSSKGLKGRIRQTLKISAKLATNLQLKASISGVIVSSDSFPMYKGVCHVVPMTISQTLNTKDHRMPDDVEVDSIPFYKVSNESDGHTFVIGG